MANIVIMINHLEEEALRHSGVLPPGMFRSFDEIGPDGLPPDDHSLYIWPYAIDYSLGADSDIPPSLPAMMGLPEAGDEELVSESYIARLFGADVFHVVFLETETGEATEGTGFTGRKATFGSLAAVTSWGERLKMAIEGRLSAEQAKLIRHHLVLIARGGQIVTTQEEADKLQAALEDNPNLHGSFFLDYNLEVEQSNILLHSTHVWPIMVGRLLLRFLLENTQESAEEAAMASRTMADVSETGGMGQDDSVCGKGLHLWRAEEFLFDYPFEKLGDQWRASIETAYKAVSESTSITQTENSGGKAFNGKDVELQSFFAPPPKLERAIPDRPGTLAVPTGSWDDVSVDKCLAWARNDNRWNDGFKNAAAKFHQVLFALSHRTWLSEQGSSNAVYYSPQAFLTKKIFRSVDTNPAQIFFKANQIEANLSSKVALGNPFEKWRDALAVEKQRREAKKTVEAAANDMKAAQSHFVPIDVGMMAVAAISLFCGFSIHRIVLALGGSFIFSICLSACAFFGAIGACVLIHWLHGARGKEALAYFVGMCNDVDTFMEKRNEQLFATIDAAAAYREVSERRKAMSGNLERLNRIRRILSREIQTPAVSVFFIDGKTKPDSIRDERKRQMDLLLSRTRHVEGLDGEFAATDAVQAKNEVDKFFPFDPVRRDGGVFFLNWKDWCSKSDRGHWGNYPARYFIPRLRRFMQMMCDHVSAKLKEDVLDKRKKQQLIKQNANENEELPTSLKTEMEDSRRTGFTYASAHVDYENIQGVKCETLYIAPRFLDAMRADSNDLIVKTSRTFSVLPHYALYFEDIPVRMSCQVRGDSGGKGRLVFAE